jgi:pimeloyl-ACP methyl ester carboxylesterase
MSRIAMMAIKHTAILVASLITIAASTAPVPELIDVGGHKMEIVRAGNGGPTVVFEPGITDLRLWSGIQPRIAEFADTLSYSHFGLGRSDPAPTTRSASRIVAELHALLQRTGAKLPYILVGHSMGGLYVRLFAITYPTEVAGLVLVDAVHERQVIEFTRLDSVGFPRRRQLALNDLEPAQRAEMDGLAPILVTSGSLPGKVPNVPMVVLTALGYFGSGWAPGSAKIWRDLHEELFQSTSYGMHIVTAKSGHLIQKDEPELVVNAIRWVVEAARLVSSLLPC